MKKNPEQMKKRRQFVSEAMENPKAAGKRLAIKAKGLENCKTTMDIIYALQDILYISEITIFRDIKK